MSLLRICCYLLVKHTALGRLFWSSEAVHSLLLLKLPELFSPRFPTAPFRRRRRGVLLSFLTKRDTARWLSKWLEGSSIHLSMKSRGRIHSLERSRGRLDRQVFHVSIN